MNYLTKVQAIRRKKAVSQCYVNLPLPLLIVTHNPPCWEKCETMS